MSDFEAGKLIGEIITSNAESLFEASKRFIVDKNSQIRSRLASTFITYIENIERKYSSTKTIIYRDTPQSIKKFYEPIDLFNDSINIENPDVNNLKKLNRPIIITGTGGSGKSTFLKYLLLNSIENSKLIPLFVELRLVEQEQKKLIDYINLSLQLNKVSLGSEYLTSAFENGNFLFLLDGFDELSQSYAQNISAEIENMSQVFTKCVFILTSRPGQEFISWSNFIELKTKPLSVEKAINLIQRLNFDEEIKQNFINQLKSNLYDSHRSFFENPLLLSIMLVTFRDSASIPSELHNFYSLAFEALYYRHDASKTFKRPTLTNLPVNKGKDILAAFSLITYISNQTIFSDHELRDLLTKAMKLSDCQCDVNELISDFLRAYCMLIQDGTKYQFTHRSFQEYFAACYLVSASDSNQNKLIQQFLQKADTDITLQLAYGMNPRMMEAKLIIPYLKEFKQNIGFNDTLTKEVFIKFANYYFSSAIIIGNELSLTIRNIDHNNPLDSTKLLNLMIARLIIKVYNIDSLFNKKKSKVNKTLFSGKAKNIDISLEEAFNSPGVIEWLLTDSVEAKVILRLIELGKELSEKYNSNAAFLDSLLEDKNIQPKSILQDNSKH